MIGQLTVSALSAVFLGIRMSIVRRRLKDRSSHSSHDQNTDKTLKSTAREITKADERCDMEPSTDLPLIRREEGVDISLSNGEERSEIPLLEVSSKDETTNSSICGTVNDLKAHDSRSPQQLPERKETLTAHPTPFDNGVESSSRPPKSMASSISTELHGSILDGASQNDLLEFSSETKNESSVQDGGVCINSIPITTTKISSSPEKHPVNLNLQSYISSDTESQQGDSSDTRSPQSLNSLTKHNDWPLDKLVIESNTEVFSSNLLNPNENNASTECPTSQSSDKCKPETDMTSQFGPVQKRIYGSTISYCAYDKNSQILSNSPVLQNIEVTAERGLSDTEQFVQQVVVDLLNAACMISSTNEAQTIGYDSSSKHERASKVLATSNVDQSVKPSTSLEKLLHRSESDLDSRFTISTQMDKVQILSAVGYKKMESDRNEKRRSSVKEHITADNELIESAQVSSRRTHQRNTYTDGYSAIGEAKDKTQNDSLVSLSSDDLRQLMSPAPSNENACLLIGDKMDHPNPMVTSSFHSKPILVDSTPIDRKVANEGCLNHRQSVTRELTRERQKNTNNLPEAEVNESCANPQIQTDKSPSLTYTRSQTVGDTLKEGTFIRSQSPSERVPHVDSFNGRANSEEMCSGKVEHRAFSSEKTLPIGKLEIRLPHPSENKHSLGLSMLSDRTTFVKGVHSRLTMYEN